MWHRIYNYFLYTFVLFYEAAEIVATKCKLLPQHFTLRLDLMWLKYKLGASVWTIQEKKKATSSSIWNFTVQLFFWILILFIVHSDMDINLFWQAYLLVSGCPHCRRGSVGGWGLAGSFVWVGLSSWQLWMMWCGVFCSCCSLQQVHRE